MKMKMKMAVWILAEEEVMASSMVRVRSGQALMDQLGYDELAVTIQSNGCTHQLQWRGSPCAAWAYHAPRTRAAVTRSDLVAMMVLASEGGRAI